jgi:hypothetical protein
MVHGVLVLTDIYSIALLQYRASCSCVRMLLLLLVLAITSCHSTVILTYTYTLLHTCTRTLHTCTRTTADPAHLPCAHHGVIGARQGAAPLSISLETSDDMAMKSFSKQSNGYLSKRFAFMRALKDTPNMIVSFEAPCLLYYQV